MRLVFLSMYIQEQAISTFGFVVDFLDISIFLHVISLNICDACVRNTSLQYTYNEDSCHVFIIGRL